MNAPNWEVRRTAAFLLREFGGTEGLKELIPLLTDPEPLVQREAIQGLIMNGSDEASADPAAGADHADRANARDAGQRAGRRCETNAPRRCSATWCATWIAQAFPQSLPGGGGSAGPFGGPDAVEALKFALHQGELWAPHADPADRAAAAATPCAGSARPKPSRRCARPPTEGRRGVPHAAQARTRSTHRMIRD